VYAVGPEGVGKSALCKYLLTRDVDAGRLVRIAQMTRIEAAGWSDRHADYVAALQDCSTLLMDDIHAVTWTDHGAGVLRAVIDWRHEAGLKTLVTSNITMRELAARLDNVMGDGWGLQTMRRLSPVHVLTMGGESYRLEMQRYETK
jgi:DNA replication protein DnaC